MSNEHVSFCVCFPSLGLAISASLGDTAQAGSAKTDEKKCHLHGSLNYMGCDGWVWVGAIVGGGLGL